MYAVVCACAFPGRRLPQHVVVASFAYIVPMLKWGTLISAESTRIPQYKWAVMGFLDSVAGIMQSLAVNYIANGSLVRGDLTTRGTGCSVCVLAVPPPRLPSTP